MGNVKSPPNRTRLVRVYPESSVSLKAQISEHFVLVSVVSAVETHQGEKLTLKTTLVPVLVFVGKMHMNLIRPCILHLAMHKLW